MNRKEGFTLIELLIAVAIFIVIIGIPYKMFINELKITLQENSKAKTEIEAIPSIEVLRKDIEMAGYGLCWDTGGVQYKEASSSSNEPLYSSNITPAFFNDNSSLNGSIKAITGIRDSSSNGFSYLVLRATIFGLNKASNHWTYIDKNGNMNIWPTNNVLSYNNLQAGDRVIVISADGKRRLTANGSQFYFDVSKSADPADIDPSDYLPGLDVSQSTYLIYGIDTDDIRAPFNRIDYFLNDGSNDPSECAEGTHTLERAVMRQSDGVVVSYPLLHCVADFQVWFWLDKNENGVVDSGEWTQDLTSENAKDIREQLKQVRVYILIQNGKEDNNYEYPYSTVYIGDADLGIGRTFDLAKNVKNYQHYRWKLIKLVAIPRNLE